MIGAQRLTMSAVSPGIVLRSTWTFCVGPNVIVAPCDSRKQQQPGRDVGAVDVARSGPPRGASSGISPLECELPPDKILTRRA